MKLQTIISTKHHTVGLATVTEKENVKRIPGYFNKDLIKEAVEKYFNLFGERDISISYASDEKAAMLLFRPDETKDIFVCIAGKSEPRDDVEDDF
jgi:hypothetical protein